MGRGEGLNNRGMLVGYNVRALCPQCEAEIDRGLSHLCYKCGDYYCESCLRFADQEMECVSLRGIYGYAICPQCWERKK